MKKIINQESMLHITQLLLFTMAANILLAAGLFAIGISVSWYWLPLSFLAAVMGLIGCYGQKIDHSILYEILSAGLILMLLILIAGLFFDTSYDGNNYHKTAVGLLKEGWNPLRDDPGAGGMWVEGYCKVTWIFGACIYAITGNLENAKPYTMIGIVCVFLITYVFLKKKQKDSVFCIIFSLAAACNPVALHQMTTFYVDGFLHVMLYLVVVSLLMIEEPEVFDRKMSISLLAASMIICGNIKFTGLLYGGIFCVAYFLWDCWKYFQKNRKAWLVPCVKEGCWYALLATVTMFVAGSSSYLTNLLHHKTFTWPLTGEGAVDIMTSNSPFSEANHFKNLFISLFSCMENISASSDRNPVLKIPFSIHIRKEARFLNGIDTRISGFGVWFSGILLIAIVVIIVCLVKMKKDENFFLYLLNLCVCLGLTFGVKESWWARYTPYIYFIVLMGLYLTLDIRKKLVRKAGILLALLLFANNGVILCFLPLQLYTASQINKDIEAMAAADEVEVYTSAFEGVYYNLKDRGVSYQIDPEIEDDPEAYKFEYGDIELSWMVKK